MQMADSRCDHCASVTRGARSRADRRGADAAGAINDASYQRRRAAQFDAMLFHRRRQFVHGLTKTAGATPTCSAARSRSAAGYRERHQPAKGDSCASWRDQRKRSRELRHAAIDENSRARRVVMERNARARRHAPAIHPPPPPRSRKWLQSKEVPTSTSASQYVVRTARSFTRHIALNTRKAGLVRAVIGNHDGEARTSSPAKAV